MAGSHVTLRIDDLPLRRALEGIERLIQNPDLMLMDMGEELLQVHRDRLVRGVDVEGVPFQPLSASYKATKKKNQHRVMVLEGELHDRYGYDVVDHSLHLGSPLIYAASHQHGDPRRGIPQREHIGIGDADVDLLQEIAGEHLLMAIDTPR